MIIRIRGKPTKTGKPTNCLYVYHKPGFQSLLVDETGIPPNAMKSNAKRKTTNSLLDLASDIANNEMQFDREDGTKKRQGIENGKERAGKTPTSFNRRSQWIELPVYQTREGKHGVGNVSSREKSLENGLGNVPESGRVEEMQHEELNALTIPASCCRKRNHCIRGTT